MGRHRYIIPIYSKCIYKGWFWVWKRGCIYWNLLGQSGCKHISFWPTKLTKLHSQKSLVLASIQWKLYFPGIWAAEICLLIWIQNSHIFLAISLHESDFMLPYVFIYVTAVVLPEKILTCFLFESFWKAVVLIQLLVIPKHLCGNVFHHQTTVSIMLLLSSWAPQPDSLALVYMI